MPLSSAFGLHTLLTWPLTLPVSFTPNVANKMLILCFFRTVILFPARVLWNLQMTKAKKYSVMAVFAVGSLCIVTATIRVASITAATGAGMPSPSWLMTWAMVETAIAVIVACLPTFGLLLPEIRATTGYGSGPRQGSAKRNLFQLGKLPGNSTGGNMGSKGGGGIGRGPGRVAEFMGPYKRVESVNKIGGFVSERSFGDGSSVEELNPNPIIEYRTRDS